MNAVVSQTLRCLMIDVTDLHRWIDYLPTIEMVINYSLAGVLDIVHFS